MQKTQIYGHFWDKGVSNSKSAENFGQGTHMHACVYMHAPMHTCTYTPIWNTKVWLWCQKTQTYGPFWEKRAANSKSAQNLGWGTCMYVCMCVCVPLHTCTYMRTHSEVPNVRYSRTKVAFWNREYGASSTRAAARMTCQCRNDVMPCGKKEGGVGGVQVPRGIQVPRGNHHLSYTPMPQGWVNLHPHPPWATNFNPHTPWG